VVAGRHRREDAFVKAWLDAGHQITKCPSRFAGVSSQAGDGVPEAISGKPPVKPPAKKRSRSRRSAVQAVYETARRRREEVAGEIANEPETNLVEMEID
jgi:hypothetical protein